MDMVFPGCLECPAFLNALLYSVVQMANKGRTTVEGLHLLGKALQSLSQAVSGRNHPRYAEIGAILILQGVAYRWKDTTSHEAHTNGLIRYLRFFGTGVPCLTAPGMKAMFWFEDF